MQINNSKVLFGEGLDLRAYIGGEETTLMVVAFCVNIK